MAYEYGVQGDGLGLASVRSYKYDKLLEQYVQSNFGPKVDKIKKEIAKMKRQDMHFSSSRNFNNVHVFFCFNFYLHVAAYKLTA